MFGETQSMQTQTSFHLASSLPSLGMRGLLIYCVHVIQCWQIIVPTENFPAGVSSTKVESEYIPQRQEVGVAQLPLKLKWLINYSS